MSKRYTEEFKRDAAGELASTERGELKRLRKQTTEQQKTIEILRKAAAYFATETIR